MLEPKDKRGVPREPVHLVTEIELNGERIGCGVSRDGSAAGFLFLTDADMAPGTKIVLRLYSPRESEPHLYPASVVRCERIPVTERQVWNYRLAVLLDEASLDLQEIVQDLSTPRTNPPPSK